MEIDACGLSCPQPVILTMNAIKDNKSPIDVLVDNNCACENVQRLAENKGYQIEIKNSGEKIQIKLTR
jgi:TusA-related sulfurtransferase